MLALSVVATAGVVFAPTAPAPADPAIVRAREQLEQAQAEANAAYARYQDAINDREQAEAQMAELEATIPMLRAREAQLRAHETELRTQLAARAAALYKNTNPTAGLEALTSRNHLEAGRKTKLTEAADEFDNERARELLETADQLQNVHVELEAKRVETEAKRAELDDVVARLERERWCSTRRSQRRTGSSRSPRRSARSARWANP